MAIDSIRCDRFGGFRPAPACVFFDRYRTCRRTCESLEKYLEDNPDMVGEALAAGNKRKPKTESLFKNYGTKRAGKDLPNSELRCPYCKTFVGKSKRGLRVHCTRTHKKRLPNE